LENTPESEYIEVIIEYNNYIITNHPFEKFDVNYDLIPINKDEIDWRINEIFLFFKDEAILSH